MRNTSLTIAIDVERKETLSKKSAVVIARPNASPDPSTPKIKTYRIWPTCLMCSRRPARSFFCRGKNVIRRGKKSIPNARSTKAQITSQANPTAIPAMTETNQCTPRFYSGHKQEAAKERAGPHGGRKAISLKLRLLSIHFTSASETAWVTRRAAPTNCEE